MEDRLVKYEKKDNKSVLVELLRLHLRCEVLLSGNNFLSTNDFRRLLVPFIPDDTLMALRCATKAWQVIVEEVIDEGVASDEIIVHDGKDIS